jgi:hypothetical protein
LHFLALLRVHCIPLEGDIFWATVVVRKWLLLHVTSLKETARHDFGLKWFGITTLAAYPNPNLTPLYPLRRSLAVTVSAGLCFYFVLLNLLCPACLRDAFGFEFHLKDCQRPPNHLG